jgi:2-oxoisovalerate dehydrogenase E2 component (dihydrolipoyl transacylase)
METGLERESVNVTEAHDFALPDLGEGLEEAEIVRWFVEVGDHVVLNQDVVEVETAKALVTVPSPFAGTVEVLGGAPGSVVAVGGLLLRVRVTRPSEGNVVAAGTQMAVDPTDGAQEADPELDGEPQPLVGYGRDRGTRTRRRRTSRTGAGDVEQDLPSAVHPTADAPTLVPAAGEPVRATPLVRRLAHELGVDLAGIGSGSGRRGAITRSDVQHAASGASAPGAPTGERQDAVHQGAGSAQGAPHQAERRVVPDVPGFRGRYPGEIEVVGGIRRRIIEKMERSRHDIPSATISRDADLTALKALRRELRAQAVELEQEISVTAMHVIMRAVVVALRRFPVLNAQLDRDAGTIELFEHINLGFAVDTPRGLLVPNLKQAQELSIAGLATGVAGLAERARSGGIAPADLMGGTFTVNNYGAFGNDDGDPIINHPEVGILGIGVTRRRPWAVVGDDGVERLEIRDISRFTLAFDHRVCDGGDAGRFVTMVADLCERPERLLFF